MATVTVFTAARMQEIEDGTVVSAYVSDSHLYLVKFDGSEVDAGDVTGPAGPAGVGFTATEIGNAVNLNTLTDAGTYVQSSDAEAAAGTNYPEAYAGILKTFTNAAGLLIQEYHIFVSNTRYYRAYISSTWGTWVKVPKVSDDILGTTYGTLSGSGTVYGSGYEKKANGKLTCWVACDVTPVANTATFRTWTYPVAFISRPDVQVTAEANAAAVLNTQASAVGNTSSGIGLTRSNTTPTTIMAKVEGFWK